MNFHDIDKLKRDPKQDNLYNLFTITFKDTVGLPTQRFDVTEEEYMRIDLVCQKIYQDDSYVDLVCNSNYIDNPLNIMESDIIYCPELQNISDLRPELSDTDDIRGALQANDNGTQIDPNRKKFVEQNYTLTPTTIDVPQEPVKIVQDTIFIGS